ncbi:ketoreductase [Microthyrium microscopicum]|uniref:Ketoreductase n=1 Tax=Microthyrium microscopicum TaxID=703497 RepID=A0A6A6UJV0_9PEZI|nr:ketoreductase [Microthyrium microscopicum]
MANIHTPIPALKLNDGTSIPMLSYGTGTARSKRGKAEEEVDREIVDGCKLAMKLNYTHFDCAESYRNEVDLGVAIKESKIDPKNLYITTKVMHSVGDIDSAIKTSLKKLQLPKVDLYLIHAPYFANEGKDEQKLQEAWKAMEKVQADGLATSIGVSNFLPAHLEAIMKTAKVTPACNQVEFHPYLPRKDLVAANKKYGIATAAYGPLSAVTKAAPGPVDDELASLARKYAVSPAEICLRWAIDQDVIAITTSDKEQRLSDYLRVTKFKLTPEEIRRLSEEGDKKHFRGFWGAKFASDERL